MGEKYAPKEGDRVRVVLEGEAWGACDEYFGLGDGGNANLIEPDAAHVVSIEKIEPPVVTFKPGDVVRGKSSGRAWAIGHKSAIALGPRPSGVAPAGEHFTLPSGYFTSENYERVDLP